jgi:hypothetical protein
MMVLGGEREFVILRQVNGAPNLASCKKCQLKFFAPKDFSRDPVRAMEYLIEKFARHSCPEKRPRQRRPK